MEVNSYESGSRFGSIECHIGKPGLGSVYYTYVLENDKGKHYIGSCGNLVNRLKEHNRGNVSSTKNRGPYKLIYQQEFSTKTEARKREIQLKSYKNPVYLRKVLGIVLSPSSSLV